MDPRVIKTRTYVCFFFYRPRPFFVVRTDRDRMRNDTVHTLPTAAAGRRRIAVVSSAPPPPPAPAHSGTETIPRWYNNNNRHNHLFRITRPNRSGVPITYPVIVFSSFSHLFDRLRKGFPSFRTTLREDMSETSPRENDADRSVIQVSVIPVFLPSSHVYKSHKRFV